CAVFLMIRCVKIFLFLVGTRGAALSEICLRLEADWVSLAEQSLSLSSLVVIRCKKRTSGAVGRKWNGSPLLVMGSGPSCCCKQGEQDYLRGKIEDLEGMNA